jgi:hypothetical protein
MKASKLRKKYLNQRQVKFVGNAGLYMSRNYVVVVKEGYLDEWLYISDR